MTLLIWKTELMVLKNPQNKFLKQNFVLMQSYVPKRNIIKRIFWQQWENKIYCQFPFLSEPDKVLLKFSFLGHAHCKAASLRNFSGLAFVLSVFSKWKAPSLLKKVIITALYQTLTCRQILAWQYFWAAAMLYSSSFKTVEVGCSCEDFVTSKIQEQKL